MLEFFRSQLSAIAALQGLPVPAAFWKIITFLGNEEFFLLLIPLVYWCISRRAGLRLGVLILGGDALNVLAKMACACPRPYWLEPTIGRAADASYGLPSSHAQNALAVWFYLASLVRKRLGKAWPYALAAVLVLVVSASRPALGVHFPIDIIAGWLIGIIWLLLFWRFSPAAAAGFRRLSFGGQVGASLGVAAIVVILGLALRDVTPRGIELSAVPADTATTGLKAIFARAGALFGLGVGVALVWRDVPFVASGTTGRKVLRFVVGLVGVLVIWRGLDAVFPRNPDAIGLTFRFVRYALLGWWITHGAPKVFVRTGLADAATAKTPPPLAEPSSTVHQVES